jgi:uncharacterized protein
MSCCTRHDADDKRSERAREVLAELAAGPGMVYLFWPVVMAFLRISTREGLFANPLPPSEALGLAGSLLGRDHVHSPGEDELFWALSWRSLKIGVRGGDLVSDAHIVALMRRHGVRTILTHGRDLRCFEGLRVRDPFA